MRTPALLLTSITALLPVLKAADTFSDFSGAITNTPGTIFQTGQNNPPVFMNEAPYGDFLRLMAEQGSVANHYAFDATHSENWSGMVGQLDFRLINSTGDPADGIGFIFLVAGLGLVWAVRPELAKAPVRKTTAVPVPA